MAVRQQSDLRLYLDILPDPSKAGYSSQSSLILRCSRSYAKKIQLDNAGTIMIFLKHFDTTRQSLYGIGKIHMPRASKVSDLIPIINERMRWASGTPLKLYEVTIATFHQRIVLMRHPPPGNQTWHDRAHETEVHLHPE
jgi:ubiquitin carboxyl-terminal hydrolase 7